MRIGIFAKTFAGSTPEPVLRAAVKAGYQSVQYNMACSGLNALPADISDGAADSVKEAANKYGLRIAAVSATYNMVHPDMEIREAGRRSFAAIAAKARQMGTQLLTVCSGSCDPDDQWRHHHDNAGPQAWGEMLDEFEHLIRTAEQHDVRIGVEPELANIVSSAAKAREMIDALKSDRIKIVLDAANLFEIAGAETRQHIIERAVDVLGPFIAIAHAKDRSPDGSFAAAGKGVIDFRHYLSCLQRSGFDGDLITHGLSAEEAPGVAHFLTAALD